MGFWSGFEGLTGHQPGAFKGFSLKDIIDKDLWERKQRTWSGKMLPQGATEAERQRDLRFSRGGEPMMTNWYKGRGAGGVPIQGDQREEVTSRNRPDIPRAQTRAFPYLPKPIAENLLTPSWAGSAASADRDVGMGAGRFLQLGDPRNIRSGPDLPPASQADRTTTIKKFADPNKSDEETTVIKDKIQGGPAYNRPPPNWLERVAHAEGPINLGYFGRPTTFSSPPQPEGALTSSAQPTSIMNMFNMKAWQDLARRKWEERQRARGGY